MVSDRGLQPGRGGLKVSAGLAQRTKPNVVVVICPWRVYPITVDDSSHQTITGVILAMSICAWVPQNETVTRYNRQWLDIIRYDTIATHLLSKHQMLEKAEPLFLQIRAGCKPPKSGLLQHRLIRMRIRPVGRFPRIRASGAIYLAKASACSHLDQMHILCMATRDVIRGYGVSFSRRTPASEIN